MRLSSLFLPILILGCASADLEDKRLRLHEQWHTSIDEQLTASDEHNNLFEQVVDRHKDQNLGIAEKRFNEFFEEYTDDQGNVSGLSLAQVKAAVADYEKVRTDVLSAHGKYRVHSQKFRNMIARTRAANDRIYSKDVEYAEAAKETRAILNEALKIGATAASGILSGALLLP